MTAPKINHIKETCLYVKDIEKSRYFYEEILGLERIHYKKDQHLFLKIGKNVLLLFNAQYTKNQTSPPPHDGEGRQHIAFETDIGQYSLWKQHLHRHQITIEQEQTWPNGGLSFYFRDPDNLCLEIVQPGIWGF